MEKPLRIGTYVEGEPPNKDSNDDGQNDSQDEAAPLLGTGSSCLLDSAVDMLVTSLKFVDSSVCVLDDGVQVFSLLLNEHLHIHKQLLEFLKAAIRASLANLNHNHPTTLPKMHSQW